jgi:hypothetical protein
VTLVGLALVTLARPGAAFRSLVLPGQQLHARFGGAACAGVPAAPHNVRTLAVPALRRRQACIVLRAQDGDGGAPTPDGNATAAWEKDLGQELLRAKRPKGVDNFVEGIPQVEAELLLARATLVRGGLARLARSSR